MVTVLPRLCPLLPGLTLCAAAAGLCLLVTRPLPLLSPLLLAILLGVLLTNTVGVPGPAARGVTFSAKHLLRAGVVLLGLQLVIGDVIGLGAGMIAVVVAVVTVGILGTLLLGRLLKVDDHLTLLVACGFSICGAAAVAAAAGVTDPDEEREPQTATAVALVVLCGTVMIAVLPALAGALDLPAEVAGLWAGGAIHEVAQVVAAGGIIGGGALAVAVVVKLARVLLLAPVMAVLGLRERRRAASGKSSAPHMPPIVPGFVVGFALMVAVRSLVPLPTEVLDGAKLLQTALLAAAMFALGCGVRVRELRAVGPRPAVLAVVSTVLVSLVSLGGVLLASPA